MSKHYRKQNDCLNCAATVHGKFCGNCGQENLDLQEPFWHFISHSIGHYFHFDTKFFNTIVPLITKPGQLTLDYIEGKRTRYLQPISMFIFISIVYFLLTPIINPKDNTKAKAEEQEIIKANGINTLSEHRKKLYFLPKELKELSIKQINKAQLVYFSNLKKERQNYIIDSLKVLASKQKKSKEINGLIKDLRSAKVQSIKKETKKKEIPEIDKSDSYGTQEVLKKYGSKVFFMLIPIFAFFLMKNLRKNKKYYVEHVIFTLHFHSFAFLALLVGSLLNFISSHYLSSILSFIFIGIFTWYIYKSLKVVYQRTRGVIIRKMFTLGILYSISFGFSLWLIQLIVNNLPKH